MKRLSTLRVMTLFNSPRAGRPTRLWKALTAMLILTLVLVPLLSRRTLLPSAQAGTQIEICGGAPDRNRIFQGCPLGGSVETAWENQAIDVLIDLHKLPASDRGRVMGWERGKMRALLYGKLLDVIKKSPASRTAEEQAAVNAFAARIKQKRLDAVNYAIEEYNKWDASPCAYAPPTGFFYSPGPACQVPLAASFQGRPNPPTFEEFQAYGVLRAYNEFNSVEAQIAAAGAARAAEFLGGLGMAGVGGSVGLAIAASLAQTTIAAIFPYAFGAATASTAYQAVAGSGATAAATGVTSMTAAIAGAVTIVIVCITIGVLRGIDVFNAEAIPGKLQETKNNVQNTPVDMAEVIKSDRGLQEVYAQFITMTLPEFSGSDSAPAQQASDPKFIIQQSGSSATHDYLLKYKSWDDSNQTARLNGGWFINKDAKGKEVWTLSIDYINWNGEKWTASRSGLTFTHTKEGAPDQTFEDFQIRYKDWNGTNVAATIKTGSLEIATAPIVARRDNPRAYHVAAVSSSDEAPDRLTVTVNGGPSATTNGITVSDLSVDSDGMVWARIAATCASTPSTFTLQVRDSLGQSKTAPLAISSLLPVGAWSISSGPVSTDVLPATALHGEVGVPYSMNLHNSFEPTSCNVTGVIQVTSGNLPPGLSIIGTHEECSPNPRPGEICPIVGPSIKGVPTSGGSSTFTIRRSFSNGDSFSRTYTVNITSNPVDAPAGMVSWWNAEHGGNDIIERNHGQASNGFGPEDFELGHVGLAFRFNGSSGAIRLRNNFFPFPLSGAGNTPFTFETWFKTASGGVIIGQQNSDPWGAPPTLYTPGLYVGQDGKLRSEMFWRGSVNPITSSEAVNDDRFHHVAVVYDGNEQVVYLDGAEMGRATHTQVGNNADYRYQFGVGYTSNWPSAPRGWYGFKGLIDEPTLYDRALNAQEARSIFAAGQAGKILIDLKVINPLCAAPEGYINTDGAVQINVKGGYAPFSYTRSDPLGRTYVYKPDNSFLNLWAGSNYTFYIRDSRGYTVEREAKPRAPLPISLSPASIEATANVGQPFMQSFQAGGGTGAKTLTLSGALPLGLTFTNDPANNAAKIIGAPTQFGTFPVTLTATDQNGCAQSQSYTLVVLAPPTITATTVTRMAGAPADYADVQIGAVNDPNGAGDIQTFTINGGAAATVNGVTVHSVDIHASGQVTARVNAACGATDAGFTLRATDKSGLSAEAPFHVTVTPNPEPSLGVYQNVTAATGGRATVAPSSAPSDNNQVGDVTVTAPNFTGLVTVRYDTGVVSISNAGPAGVFTVSVKAVDNCGAAITRTFLLTVSSPPTITAKSVTRGAGAPAASAQIGAVNDPNGVGDIQAVTVNGAASATVNGITVSSINVDSSGQVTASVVAACGATDAGFTLRVTDKGGLSAETTLNVTVPSAIGDYSNVTVAPGDSETVTPSAPPLGDGSISSVTVTAPNFTGGLTVDPTTGAVSISNAGPVGIFTVSVKVTDTCGSTTTRTFQVNVGQPVVVGWGDNQYGQVNIPADLRDVTAIDAGGLHSLALKSDGTVVTWGRNFPVMNPPDGLSGVRAISAGYLHSLALKSDGTVVAWGSNVSHRLDIPAGLSDVTAISAGYNHSLALKSDGTVVAWGDNTVGQLNIPAGLSDVTAISAGGLHSLALKSDGTVVAWGDNRYGQSDIPAGLRDVTAVSAGFWYSLALKSDGTVVAWADNSYGWLNIPAGLSGVKAISAGDNHSLALKFDGTVVSWGENQHGERTVPAGLRDVTAISAGTYFSLALKTNPIMVTNTNDSGPGSLRQAIADAPPGGVIAFDLIDCPCAITLTSGDLYITKPLTINGPGANLLSIDGNNNSRVFAINQSGAVTLSGLTVTNGNGSAGSGGGVWGSGGTLIINDCAIVGNSSLSGVNNGMGGGIHFGSGVLRMAGSVISGNRASFIGGLSVENATASLINCTISGNSVTASGSGIVARGSSEVTLTNCTVTANSSPGGDGAVRADSQWGASVAIKLRNTLVANNGARNFTVIKWPSGNSATITSLGNNLDGDGSSGFTNGVNGDLVGTASNPLDALLGPLADNGGPTKTHALLPGSPAINAGGGALVRDANGNHLCFDQRGLRFLRLIGGVVDIGAFEAPSQQP